MWSLDAQNVFMKGLATRAAVVGVAMLGAACRQDMFDQARYEPLEQSDLFPDGAAARQPPRGTVARRDPRSDRELHSGVDAAGRYLSSSPFPVDEALLRRGQERFGIYCSPCHGLAGHGDGMIVLRGFKRPPSLHEDRLRAQPTGYFVDVVANGFGVMPSYATQVPPRDRWAIAAYVGALQLSQHAQIRDLPPEDAARLEGVK